MGNWVTIPRWVYENNLPDDELQRVYVQQAEAKYAQCVEERKALELAVAQALTVEANALDFLTDAREALRKYERPRATVEPVEEAPYTETRKRLPPGRRALPGPGSGGR